MRYDTVATQELLGSGVAGMRAGTSACVRMLSTAAIEALLTRGNVNHMVLGVGKV